MRRWARPLIVIGLVAAAGGFAIVWSGVLSVAASSGHWPVTEWLLHFAMRRSVKTHALFIDTPTLDDARMIRRGAGHYASGCAPCHGAPGIERAAVARQMTPAPPALLERLREWKPEELFWIVRHGIKFTGMPAWIAQRRDDEIWAVVSFLGVMPRLDEADYRRLAFGAADEHQDDPGSTQGGMADLSPSTVANCARCHGSRGGTDGGAFPLLAGQSEEYLYATLRAFAEGTRFSGIMQAAVAGLGNRDLRALAKHYATAQVSAEPPPSSGRAASEGESLVREGAPERGIPPCASCHGAREGPRHSRYPSLAGQPADYLVSQLELFRKDARGGSSYAHIMRTIAQRLDRARIEAAAGYYASLPRRHAGR